MIPFAILNIFGPTPVYILALETATIPASFALAQDDRVLQSVQQAPGEQAAETLLVELDGLLRRLPLSPQVLDVVGLTIGPGSFTGLRCGAAIAKMLGYSLGCRLVALDTMQVIAGGVAGQRGVVRVVMDAQRNGVYWQQYQLQAGQPPQPLQEVQIDAVADLQQRLTPGEHLIGPGLSKLADQPSSNDFDRDVMAGPRADVVATLTNWAASSGQFCDPWTLIPRYVGKSAADERK
jgi:tRNA threonylcarbamoyladenosine biosynthesis protein TsaB